MAERPYQYNNDQALFEFEQQQRDNLDFLRKRAGSNPDDLHLHNQISDTERNIAELHAEMLRRGLRAAPEPVIAPQTAHIRPISVQAHQSGFTLAPLAAEQPLFGRDEVLQAIMNDLDQGRSVNIFGEKGLGKTSLLNHIYAHGNNYIQHTPLTFIWIDLKAANSAERFYAAVCQSMFAALNEQHPQQAHCSYDEFCATMQQLKGRLRAVVIVDNLQEVLKAAKIKDFPYPEFFNALWTMVTQRVFALVVASPKELAAHEQEIPGRFGSSLPAILVGHALKPLDPVAADQLLTQGKRLDWNGPAELATARRWADGIPLRLQALAIQAEKHGTNNIDYASLNRTFASTAKPTPPKPARSFSLLRIVRWIFIDMPLGLGRLIQRTGLKIDDIGAWLIGMAFIIGCILALGNFITAGELWNATKNFLGIGE